MSAFIPRSDCLNCRAVGCWFLILAPVSLFLAWLWSITERPAHIGPEIKAPWQDRLVLFARKRLRRKDFDEC